MDLRFRDKPSLAVYDTQSLSSTLTIILRIKTDITVLIVGNNIIAEHAKK